MCGSVVWVVVVNAQHLAACSTNNTTTVRVGCCLFVVHTHPQVLFAGADIAVAWQLWRLGQLQGTSQSRCVWSMLLWLYNPFTATISTRGSCDSLVTVMLLATLLMLLQGGTVLPALLYGLAVHFRIFPIVYAPGVVLYLAHRQLQGQQQRQPGAQEQPAAKPATTTSSKAVSGTTAPPAPPSLSSWLAAVLQQGLVFGGISGAVFLLLGVGFYQLYGHTFLHEAFLHHTTRKDPRHNFSVYYYPIYLDFMPWPQQAGGSSSIQLDAISSSSSTSSSNPAVHWLLQLAASLPPVDANRFAAVPQLVLLLVLSVCLHRDLPLCWLLQTWAFVAFNKVSTAQYFVWYLSFLPIALQRVPWPLPKGLRVSGAAWVLTQLHWLLWGYLLEFEGRGVHLWLWVAGALFLAANVACMCSLMRCCSSGDGGSCNAAGGASSKVE